MIGFSYEYKESTEIFNNILKISDYGFLEFSILIGGFIFMILSILFIIPSIIIFFKRNDFKKERKAKEKIKNKILLQKSLEDLIMREINEKNVKN